MTILDVAADHAVSLDSGSDNSVLVKETHIGQAVFANRSYPAGSVIGEITGRVFFDEAQSDSYTFDYDGSLLEPDAPFRFLNHSCDANCEFDILDIPESDDGQAKRGLFLLAYLDIQAGDELTIDYNWPADHAIECLCGSEHCRGWVVAEEELELIGSEAE